MRTIPIAPTLDTFDGNVAASYSNTSGTGGDNYNVQAIINIPLINDKIAVRAVGYEFRESGYYQNRAQSDAAFQTAVVVPFGVQAFAANQNEVGANYVVGGRIAAVFRRQAISGSR